MDNINETWVILTDEMADKFERGYINIDRFTDDQLMFLIYWNFGYSGINTVEETNKAMAELEYRGNPYNEEYAQQIVDKTEDYL